MSLNDPIEQNAYMLVSSDTDQFLGLSNDTFTE